MRLTVNIPWADRPLILRVPIPTKSTFADLESKVCCDSNLDCRDTEFLADDGSVLADNFKPEDLCVDLEPVNLMK